MIVLTLLKSSGKISTFFPSLLLPVFVFDRFEKKRCLLLHKEYKNSKSFQSNKQGFYLGR